VQTGVPGCAFGETYDAKRMTKVMPHAPKPGPNRA
jgi:hypothetical protein